MKFVIILILATVALVCSDFTSEEEKKWQDFKLEHGKLFLSKNKEQERKATFLKNAAEVEAHNEKYERGESSFKQKLYKHADLTPEEFLKKFSGIVMP